MPERAEEAPDGRRLAEVGVVTKEKANLLVIWMRLSCRLFWTQELRTLSAIAKSRAFIRASARRWDRGLQPDVQGGSRR